MNSCGSAMLSCDNAKWKHLLLLILTVIMLHILGIKCEDQNLYLKATPDIPNNNIEIQCYLPLNTEVKSSLYLFCPLMDKQTSCFEKCKRTCSSKEQCPLIYDDLAAITCAETETGFRYKIMSVSNKAYVGDFHCTYQSKVSAKYTYIVQAKPPPPTTPEKLSTPAKPPSPPELPIPEPDLPKPIEPPEDTDNVPFKDNKENNKDDNGSNGNKNGFKRLLRGITRADLIITILSLLTISLLVNVAFCIRCILVRRYMDAQKLGETNTRCLEDCLCVRRPRVAHNKADGSNHIFHHRGSDCVYEDPNALSSVNSRPHSSVRTSHIELYDMTPIGPMPPTAISVAGTMPRSRTFPSPHYHGTLPTNLSEMAHQHHFVNQQGENSNGAANHQMAIMMPGTMLHRGSGGYGIATSGPGGPNVIYAIPARRAGSVNMIRGSQMLYDEVAGGDQVYVHPPPLMRQASSTGSLYRNRRVMSPTIGSPLPEETAQLVTSPFMEREGNAGSTNQSDRDDNQSLSSELMEECSKNTTRLELSKMMLEKADTLLREAGTLLQN